MINNVLPQDVMVTAGTTAALATESPVNILMLNGWKWKDYNGEEDRFRRFDGYDYITKGIDDFNKNNKWGLIIDAPIIDNTNWY